jgi:hypothetical protein
MAAYLMNTMRRTITYGFVAAYAACLLFAGRYVAAAEISLDADAGVIGAGQQIEVSVVMDTGGESMNAIEGAISFPENVLEVEKVYGADSLVDLWIEKPHAEPGGRIVFSGVVPGGYAGKGMVMSIVFSARREGEGAIAASDVRLLRNDGEGTQIQARSAPLRFLVASQRQASEGIRRPQDKEPPEQFTPQIASDPGVFGGKRFLVFATQDKGSGIARYEVREGAGESVEAESPYLLRDQHIAGSIAVRAIDNEGNERVAVVPAQDSAGWSWGHYILAVALLAALIMIIFWKILWKK